MITGDITQVDLPRGKRSGLVEARDLMRGQRLNVYLPSDRWAIIHEDVDGPDIADAIPLETAPMLPKTASQLPLIGVLGAGLLLAGGAFTVLRRRATARLRG